MPTWSELNRVKRERDQLIQLVGELTVKLSSAQKKADTAYGKQECRGQNARYLPR